MIVVSMYTMILIAGCTKGTTKIVIDAQRDIERKQDEVFQRMLHNSKTYIFNKIKAAKTDEEYDAVYKEREALETYVVQWERLRTYRIVTVDRFLFDSQGILDLEYKKWSEWYKGIKNDQVAASQPATIE